MARATPTPLVDHTLLLQSRSTAGAILVGSPSWYAWLADATSFTFVGEHGTFTAHKERRAHQGVLESLSPPRWPAPSGVSGQIDRADP